MIAKSLTSVVKTEELTEAQRKFRRQEVSESMESNLLQQAIANIKA